MSRQFGGLAMLFLGLSVGAGGACDPGTEALVPDATLASGEPAQLWAPNGAAGTKKNPVFGVNCRPWRPSLWTSGPSAGNDGAMSLAWDTDATVSVALNAAGSAGAKVEGALVFDGVSPKNKSFMGARGTVTFGLLGALGGTVIDGTLCFEKKLVPGTATRGEFALIIDGDDGSPYALGGAFALPGNAITLNGTVSVDGTALTFDLQSGGKR